MQAVRKRLADATLMKPGGLVCHLRPSSLAWPRDSASVLFDAEDVASPGVWSPGSGEVELRTDGPACDSPVRYVSANLCSCVGLLIDG